MSEVRISAEPRTEFGKGGARRTRRAGKVPAVLYGHGTDPRHISLPAREFERALHTEGGANVLLSLDIEGGNELALPKSIQRDPVRGSVEHVDLILVRRGEKITVEVPIQLTGDVVSGGLVDHQLTTLSVSAEATHIPSGFEVPIGGLEIGGSVHAKEVELPTGTELVTDGDAVVVHVLAAPTAEQMEGDLDVTAAEPAAAAEAASGDVVPDTESGEGGPAESADTAAAE
ncbi:MAG: large subunit ribosomal protein [Frankiaceae bacterium]|nr:large subunit ribosomal protein [Frankiaceae bacterium]